MRTLESLIKAKGGWKKLKSDLEFANPLLNCILDRLKISKEELDEILLSNELIAKKFPAGFSDIVKAIDSNIDEAYELAERKVKANDMSGTLPLLTVLPSCVLKTMYLNMIFLPSYFNDKHGFQIMFAKAETNKQKEALNKLNNNMRTFSDFVGYSLFDLIGLFVFTNTPENQFWGAILNCLSKRTRRNSYTIISDKFKKITDIDIYSKFLDAHPECEKEIKEFCK